MKAGGREQPDSHEDVRLCALYQQITELQAPRFGAGYDIEKGVERYRAWLDDQDGHAEAVPDTANASGGRASACPSWSSSQARYRSTPFSTS